MQYLEQGADHRSETTAAAQAGLGSSARLELAGNLRAPAAIDSKPHGRDLVQLAVTDLVKDDRVRERVSVIQSKTNRPVQLEQTENTRETVPARVRSSEMFAYRFIFPGRFHDRPHISTRQFGQLVPDWVTAIGLVPSENGTHSLRRARAAEIYLKTGNLRAVQLLPGRSKIDSTLHHFKAAFRHSCGIGSCRALRSCVSISLSVLAEQYSAHLHNPVCRRAAGVPPLHTFRGEVCERDDQVSQKSRHCCKCPMSQPVGFLNFLSIQLTRKLGSRV